MLKEEKWMFRCIGALSAKENHIECISKDHEKSRRGFVSKECMQ